MCKSCFRRHSKDDAKDMLSKDYLKYVNNKLPILKTDAQNDRRYNVNG